ncbi:MAG TPA: glutamate synthase subunit alpha, partial [Chloroflexota bacterium]|nr:glutamate synthase subunit alpha [Chloroflexota bacterium]
MPALYRPLVAAGNPSIAVREVTMVARGSHSRNGDGPPEAQGLYDPAFEHDACGTGFVARISGTPSHDVVAFALESVINLTHRGAVDADARTGDGAGLLTPLPYGLFRRELARLGRRLEDPDDLAVGVIFLPRDDPAATALGRTVLERAILAEGLTIFGWRTVPIRPEVLGEKGLATLPDIQHVLIGRRAGLSGAAFERALYLVRKRAERDAAEAGLKNFYVASLSSRTIVYKGLFVAPQLRGFYRDLRDADYEVCLAVFHQRYSTNTFPTWHLAQPFRMLAHNGEINTRQGNINWMRARQPELHSPVWGDRLSDLFPITQPGGSDSADLDNALELLTMSGRDIRHSLMMLMPHAWEHTHDIDRQRRAFYAYHACLTEPWDGPAALAFTDGTIVGSALDRNGLRPSRYIVTRDGLVVAGSEVGMLERPELDDHNIAEKGRLGPGQMIAVDTRRGEILKNQQLARELPTRRPYGEWLEAQQVRLKSSRRPAAPETEVEVYAAAPDIKLERLFGYSRE